MSQQDNLSMNSFRNEFDLNDELQKLAPYEEYVLPSKTITVDELYLSKPVYLTGSPDSCIIVKGRIVAHLERSYAAFSTRQRRLEAIFKDHTCEKNGVVFSMTRNRVIISGIRFVYQPDPPTNNTGGQSNLFEISPQTTVTISGCHISSSAQVLQQQLSIFTRADYFENSPEFAVMRAVISIESCTLAGFDHVYEERTNVHSLLINRTQIIHIRSDAISISKQSEFCIENSTFSNCTGTQIVVLAISHSSPYPKPPSKKPQQLSLNNKMMQLAGTGSSMGYGQLQDQSSPFSNAAGESRNRMMPIESNDPASTPTGFAFIRNVNFLQNLAVCIVIDQQPSDNRGRVYFNVKDCTFELNIYACIAVRRNRCVSTNIVNCRFSKNTATVLDFSSSLNAKIVSCKFEDNTAAIVNCKDTALLFSKCVCYRNKSGLIVSNTPGLSLLCFVNILQNRFDGTEFDAIEVTPCNDLLRVSIQINIVANCRNGFVINSMAIPPHWSSPIVDSLDNDVVECKEYGYLVLGSRVQLTLKQDLIKDNGLGAICVQSGGFDNPEQLAKCLVLDSRCPPKITGNVIIDGQIESYNEKSKCTLI